MDERTPDEILWPPGIRGINQFLLDVAPHGATFPYYAGHRYTGIKIVSRDPAKTDYYWKVIEKQIS